MGFSRWFIHTCNIQENTPTQNDIGEEIASWSNSETGVACRYVVSQERRPTEGASAQILTITKLFLPKTVTVSTEHRITNITLEDETVLSGPFKIEQVLPRRAKSLRHVTLVLENT